jgi:hypothetical protein
MGKRYVFRPNHPQASAFGFVAVEALGLETQEEAKNAPICMDRFYENTKATDGTDIGSRRKHREYMKAHGLTTADDYTQTWSEASREREKRQTEGFDHKERREVIGRALYERSRRHGR